MTLIYPSPSLRLVSVSEQQVKIWFQNRRTKWKKQENVTSEQKGEGSKRKVDEDEDESDCFKKKNIDTLNTKVTRYEVESDDNTNDKILTSNLIIDQIPKVT